MSIATPRNWRDRFGLAAERYVAHQLEAAGLRIVARRYRCKAGEIDLIARDGAVLVFIEVKARTSTRFGEPIEAVGWRKQQRLVRAARHYLRHRRGGGGPKRFDVVGIISHAGRLRIEWIRDAFGS